MSHFASIPVHDLTKNLPPPKDTNMPAMPQQTINKNVSAAGYKMV